MLFIRDITLMNNWNDRGAVTDNYSYDRWSVEHGRGPASERLVQSGSINHLVQVKIWQVDYIQYGQVMWSES